MTTMTKGPLLRAVSLTIVALAATFFCVQAACTGGSDSGYGYGYYK